LQFNSAFTFAHAAELVPYLHELGVSHCYASPYFHARPGSTHGYDIVDHGAFNPEIGDEPALERFAAELARRGMGQVLDMVPNERMEDGRAKRFTTWKGLAARREHSTLFAKGEYVPLETAGEHAERLCVFARVASDRAAIAVAPRLVGGLVEAHGAPLGRAAWADTRIVLPARVAGGLRNPYTAEELAPDGAGTLRAAEVLRAYPVALLLCNMDAAER